jgi:hypothetical protein
MVLDGELIVEAPTLRHLLRRAFYRLARERHNVKTVNLATAPHARDPVRSGGVSIIPGQ